MEKLCASLDRPPICYNTFNPIFVIIRCITNIIVELLGDQSNMDDGWTLAQYIARLLKVFITWTPEPKNTIRSNIYEFVTG